MTRTLKNVQIEKQTLFRLEYGRKDAKKNGKIEMHTVGPGLWWEKKIMENEKQEL